MIFTIFRATLLQEKCKSLLGIAATIIYLLAACSRHRVSDQHKKRKQEHPFSLILLIGANALLPLLQPLDIQIKEMCSCHTAFWY
jgi:hypothetical protein